MASAPFCYLETILAVIKVVIYYRNINFLAKYILRMRASEAIERVLKWIVFNLNSTNNFLVNSSP